MTCNTFLNSDCIVWCLSAALWNVHKGIQLWPQDMRMMFEVPLQAFCRCSYPEKIAQFTFLCVRAICTAEHLRLCVSLNGTTAAPHLGFKPATFELQTHLPNHHTTLHPRPRKQQVSHTFFQPFEWSSLVICTEGCMRDVCILSYKYSICWC